MEILNTWQNAEEIFYPNEELPYPILDNIYDPKYLKYSDEEFITQQLYFPLRTIIGKIDKYTYYADGRMEKENLHSIYPGESIDKIYLLNSYGQMVFNNYMNKKYSHNTTDIIDYSIL